MRKLLPPLPKTSAEEWRKGGLPAQHVEGCMGPLRNALVFSTESCCPQDSSVEWLEVVTEVVAGKGRMSFGRDTKAKRHPGRDPVTAEWVPSLFVHRCVKYTDLSLKVLLHRVLGDRWVGNRPSTAFMKSLKTTSSFRES